jgi:N-acetylneuraminic acid mutarotase
MVVWGGRSTAGAALGTGGVYDPVANTWTETATAGAPPARWGHTGSWSGSALWIWGGTPEGSTVLGDGGRYDPAADTWTAMSGTGAPAARADHRAVWTGTQLIVWGGSDGASPHADGGRYVAATESWLPMTAEGAPAGRRLHSAIWTGSRLLVFGGLDSSAARTDGARYDPANDTWSAMAGGVWAPSTRRNSVTVSTGVEFIVYGGESVDLTGPEWTATGAIYDAATDAWRPVIPPDPAHVPPREAAAVWTGSAMIVWGGREPSGAEAAVDRGGRYDPALDAWTPVATSGAPAARSLHTAVWNGTDMIVWGGVGTAILDSGGRYDPLADAWTPIASGGTARYGHTAVWTGSKMIAWGGQGVATGGLGGAAAIYDAGTNSWSSSGNPLPGSDPPPTARINHTAVWTGSRMIVWGGQKPDSAVVKYRDGASYDPAQDRWFQTSSTGGPSVRDKHTAIWNGSRMVVWGGTNSCCFLSDGGEFDATANAWTPTFVPGAPAPRGQHMAGLLGSATIVWGGLGLGSRTLNSGATYCGCSTYADVDGDGYGNPDGLLRDCSFVAPPPGYVTDNRDCNDASATVNPGAADDTCDGIDQNCSGAADEGFVGSGTTCGAGVCAAAGTTSCVGGAIVDSCTAGTRSPEICDGIDNDCDGFVDNAPPGVSALITAKSGAVAQLDWPAVFSADSYDVTRGVLGALRAGGGDFTPSVDACLASGQAGTTASDPAPAPPADGFWYLVRANNCAGAGSFDEGIASQIGARDAEVGASLLACP